MGRPRLPSAASTLGGARVQHIAGSMPSPPLRPHLSFAYVCHSSIFCYPPRFTMQHAGRAVITAASQAGGMQLLQMVAHPSGLLLSMDAVANTMRLHCCSSCCCRACPLQSVGLIMPASIFTGKTPRELISKQSIKQGNLCLGMPLAPSCPTQLTPPGCTHPAPPRPTAGMLPGPRCAAARPGAARPARQPPGCCAACRRGGPPAAGSELPPGTRAGSGGARRATRRVAGWPVPATCKRGGGGENTMCRSIGTRWLCTQPAGHGQGSWVSARGAAAHTVAFTALWKHDTSLPPTC